MVVNLLMPIIAAVEHMMPEEKLKKLGDFGAHDSSAESVVSDGLLCSFYVFQVMSVQCCVFESHWTTLKWHQIF